MFLLTDPLQVAYLHLGRCRDSTTVPLSCPETLLSPLFTVWNGPWPLLLAFSLSAHLSHFPTASLVSLSCATLSLWCKRIIHASHGLRDLLSNLEPQLDRHGFNFEILLEPTGQPPNENVFSVSLDSITNPFRCDKNRKWLLLAAFKSHRISRKTNNRKQPQVYLLLKGIKKICIKAIAVFLN